MIASSGFQVGLFWIAHHIHFQYIVRVNRPLLWINILGLLFVALIPFSTALLGEYFLDRFAVFFYGANLFLAAWGGVAMWWYAVGHDMLREDVGPEIVKRRKRASLITVLALLLATFLALVSVVCVTGPVRTDLPAVPAPRAQRPPFVYPITRVRS